MRLILQSILFWRLLFNALIKKGGRCGVQGHQYSYVRSNNVSFFFSYLILPLTNSCHTAQDSLNHLANADVLLFTSLQLT